MDTTSGQADTPPPSTGTKPPRRWSPLVLTIGVVVGIAIAVGGFFGYRALQTSPEEKPLMVMGQMTLRGADAWEQVGPNCTGSGGYSDIHKGSTVTLSTGSGTTVGLASLGAGVINGWDCAFVWSMPDVPPGEKFYKLEIVHRGGLTYGRAEIELPLTTTLGEK